MTDGVEQIDLDKQRIVSFESASQRKQHINHAVKRELSYFHHLVQKFSF